jgi:hypothetical protein
MMVASESSGKVGSYLLHEKYMLNNFNTLAFFQYFPIQAASFS